MNQSIASESDSDETRRRFTIPATVAFGEVGAVKTGTPCKMLQLFGRTDDSFALLTAHKFKIAAPNGATVLTFAESNCAGGTNIRTGETANACRGCHSLIRNRHEFFNASANRADGARSDFLADSYT